MSWPRFKLGCTRSGLGGGRTLGANYILRYSSIGNILYRYIHYINRSWQLEGQVSQVNSYNFCSDIFIMENVQFEQFLLVHEWMIGGRACYDWATEVIWRGGHWDLSILPCHLPAHIRMFTSIDVTIRKVFDSSLWMAMSILQIPHRILR